eukprot:7598136-Pyramimonas_sp.AAC.1
MQIQLVPSSPAGSHQWMPHVVTYLLYSRVFGKGYATDKRLRRCGRSIVSLGCPDGLSLQLNAVMCGSLPTAEPSSPRAELYAFLMVITHTVDDVLYYSDYLPLVNGLRQPRAQVVASSTMLDLWVRIWSALDDRGPGR